METRYGRRSALHAVAISAALFLVICSVPSSVIAAGESSYAADTQVSVNGVPLTILAGGTAQSVTYGSASMTVVAGTGNSITIQGSSASTILTNDSGLPSCGNPEAQITITTGTVVITPEATGCPIAASSGRSSGSVILYGCKDPSAINYDQNSSVIAENSECLYQTQNLVCSDPNASNYSPNGTSYPAKCVYGGSKQDSAVISTQTQISQPTNATTVSFTFAKNLKQGMDDPYVSDLQQFLDTHGFPVATIGWGSLDQLATVFGKKTDHALKLYQASIHLPATGYFGPMTRAYINNLLVSGE